jgi:HD-GYP domain-containing protein (c-di-GMP phosphodiesterase class II)
MTSDSIQALLDAIELKDQSTAAHTWRVVLYSRALADEAGERPDDVDRLMYAAALHDVGKLGVSGAVLSKQGSLTGDERLAMQKHTTLGHEILVGMGADDPLMLDLVLQHHERWDGLGYPNGLRGEQINVAARRFAVVDSFDAMTSIRPYRTQVGAEAGERALAELEAGVGTRYWGPAVASFARLYRTGELDWIRDHFNDLSRPPRFGPVDLADLSKTLKV